MTTTSTFGWDHMHHSPRPSPNPTHNPNTTLPTTNYEEEEAGDDDDGYEVVPVPSRASIERHTPQQPPPRVGNQNNTTHTNPPPPGGVSYAILEDCRDLMQIVDRLHQHYDHTQQLHHEKVMLEKVVRQQDDIIQVLEESTSSSSRLLEDSNNHTNVFEKDVVVQETTQQQLIQSPPPPEHVEILLQQEVKIEELLTLLEVTRAELNLYKARQPQTNDGYSQTDEVLLSSFDAVKRLEIENQELKEFMIQLQDSASSYKSQQSMQQQSYWKMFLLLKQTLSSMHDSVCTNASSPMKKEKDTETDSSETEILPILQRCLHWTQQIGKYISRCQILLDNNGRTTSASASNEATAVITTLSIQPVEHVDTCTSTVESVQDLILQIQQLQQRMLHLTETNKSLSESLMNLQTQHSALVADTEKYKRKHKKRADEELVQFKTSTSMLLTLNKEELEELRGLAIVHKERIEKWKVNFERQQQGEQQNRTPTPSKQRRYGGGGSTGKQQQMLLDNTLSDATTALIHNVEKNFEWLVEDASVLEVSLDRMVGRGQQIIGLFMELNLGSDDSHNKKKK
eukprot:PhF_6_TR40510/c0_g1_i4/m.60640